MQTEWGRYPVGGWFGLVNVWFSFLGQFWLDVFAVQVILASSSVCCSLVDQFNFYQGRFLIEFKLHCFLIVHVFTQSLGNYCLSIYMQLSISVPACLCASMFIRQSIQT